MAHIAILIPGLNRIGGAEQQVILLSLGLVRRCWRVTVIALSGDGGAAASQLASGGVGFVRLEMRKGLADPRGWLRLRRWLQCEKPEILHAHLPHAAWMARWSRLGAPCRVLIDTLHSSSTGAAMRHAGYRLSDWLTDRVTAVSEAVAETHRTAKMVRPDKLLVLANGIDLERWRPHLEAREELREQLGLKDEFLWVAVGRLDAVKNYPVLLRALARTPESGHLAIAGSGPLEEDLRRQVRGLNLGNRVRFLGFEPDVLRWLQAADGFVLASRWEGLPLAVLEASACALPVAATDVAGTREVVLPGQTGLLSASGDATALSESMMQIMQMNSSERARMGGCGRAFVAERFSLGSALDRWETLYAALLQQNPIPRRIAHF